MPHEVTEQQFWMDMGYDEEQIENGDTEEVQVFKIKGVDLEIRHLIEIVLYLDWPVKLDSRPASRLLHGLGLGIDHWFEIVKKHDFIYHDRVGEEEWFAVTP